MQTLPSAFQLTEPIGFLWRYKGDQSGYGVVWEHPGAFIFPPGYMFETIGFVYSQESLKRLLTCKAKRFTAVKSNRKGLDK